MSCKFIVVEGPDCVGKGFFIQQFVSYILRSGMPYRPIDLMPADERQALESTALTKVPNEFYRNVDLAEVLYRTKLQEVQPGAGPTIAVANISEATEENKEFTRALHAGELTQEQIAAEYLQVIYDHHNYAKRLGESHDIVLLDRSLPSYYAYQICALGFEDQLPKWKQLYEIMMGEVDYHLVHLDAPLEVIAERKAQKKGVSKMDDVYFEKTQKIRDGYADCYAKGHYPFRILIDATAPGERPYDDFFKSIVVEMNLDNSL